MSNSSTMVMLARFAMLYISQRVLIGQSLIQLAKILEEFQSAAASFAHCFFQAVSA